MTNNATPLIHICLREDLSFSEVLAHRLDLDPSTLEPALKDWIDFAIESSEACIFHIPLIGLPQDHFFVMRRDGRLFVVYAHPYRHRSDVAAKMCLLNKIINHAPHRLILMNTTCHNRVWDIFSSLKISMAEAA